MFCLGIPAFMNAPDPEAEAVSVVETVNMDVNKN